MALGGFWVGTADGRGMPLAGRQAALSLCVVTLLHRRMQESCTDKQGCGNRFFAHGKVMAQMVCRFLKHGLHETCISA